MVAEPQLVEGQGFRWIIWFYLAKHFYKDKHKLFYSWTLNIEKIILVLIFVLEKFRK